MSLDEGTGPRATESLQDAVEHLESVAFVPPKQRHTDASQLAKTIASDAYEHGIAPATLERVLRILTAKNNLDQSTCTTLVKNLYPLERVSSKLVTQVVCCLGPSKNKPSPASQALLLRWLLLVYDFMEDRSHLSKLYAVLFNYLDMISLRKPLCHLLSLITRRKHVKPFRIQGLMELLRNTGNEEKELVSLLKVFKNYYPDIIVGDLGMSRKAGLIFRHPDPEWSSRARNLQEMNAERSLGSQHSSFQVVHRGLVKRSKAEAVVPDVQTSRVPHGHTSLEELRGIDHFVERLDKIELPNQIISTLGDRFAQKYLFLVQSETANARLDDWLTSFLEDKLEQLQDGEDDDPETLTYILLLVVEYVRYAKETPTAVTSFLKTYLLHWNGRDNREQIFQLLEYLPIDTFDSTRDVFLSPLEAAVLDDTLASRVALLEFYSALVRQWGVKLRTQSSASPESKPLSRLILHAELLALSILEIPATTYSVNSNTDQSKPATLSVLEFYSTLAELFSYAASNGNIRLTIPLSPTVYTLVFTPMSSVISIISSVLASYKSSFEASLASEVLQAQNNGTENLYPTQLVGQFNGYVMDICNLLWRNRGLNSEDPNALGCLIPASTITMLTQYIRESNDVARERRRDNSFNYTLSSIFSLSHHAALCNMSAACFNDIEDEQAAGGDMPRLRKPVTQKALSALEKSGGAKISWQEYRVQMLDWLDVTGNQGIGDLMRSTMKALRKE